MTTVYNDDILFFDGINVLDLALLNQTPFYLYSEKMIANNFLAYQKSFKDNPHLICYSVKANSNLSILSGDGSFSNCKMLSIKNKSWKSVGKGMERCVTIFRSV